MGVVVLGLSLTLPMMFLPSFPAESFKRIKRKENLSQLTVFLFIGSLLCNWFDVATGSKSSACTSSNVREYVLFLVPDQFNELGHKCLQHSQYFCMMGYIIEGKLKNRQAEQNDSASFADIIKSHYKDFHWFSFKHQ